MALDSIEMDDGMAQPDSIEVTSPVVGHANWGWGSPVYDINAGVGAQSMPKYYDIHGKQHVNYAYVQGPHSGKVCDCQECAKFNADFENRAEQIKLLDKVQKEAHEMMRSYYYGVVQSNGTIDINTAMQIMVNFTKKQIAEYQHDMVQRVQQIQLEHTARLHTVMNQQNKMAEVRRKRDLEKRKAGEHDGRLFRVGEKEETD